MCVCTSTSRPRATVLRTCFLHSAFFTWRMRPETLVRHTHVVRAQCPNHNLGVARHCRSAARHHSLTTASPLPRTPWDSLPSRKCMFPTLGNRQQTHLALAASICTPHPREQRPTIFRVARRLKFDSVLIGCQHTRRLLLAPDAGEKQRAAGRDAGGDEGL